MSNLFVQPAWMSFAWADLGVAEGPGSRNNARVVGYFQTVGHGGIADDAVPWCAAFVGACLERAGIPSSRSLAARSYLQWGAAAASPSPGAIAVLSRGSDPAAGHVGFVVGATGERVFLLGGNQGDAVTIAGFDHGRVLGYRVPSSTRVEEHAQPGDGSPDLAPESVPPPGASADDDALFAQALAMVLAFEGGYSDDPFDPGGATNKGITLATYAREIGVAVTGASQDRLKAELRVIPDALVEHIYRERYWRPACCPELPSALALFHFDAAVNQGVGTAARMLQDALRVERDGEIGPLTIGAADQADEVAVLDRYAEIRRIRYRSLSIFWRFGRGWLRRTDAALAQATRLAGSAPAVGPKATATQSIETSSTGETTMSDDRFPNASFPTDATPSPAAKWWGGSLTIWGALLTGLTTVAPAVFAAFGLDVSADLMQAFGRDLIAVVQALGGLLGTAMTIAGRMRASARIERRTLTLRV